MTDSPTRPRILLITPSLPWPPTSGGYQRTNLLYRALSEFAAVDTLVASRFATVDQDTEETLRRDYGLVDSVIVRRTSDRFPWRLLGLLSTRLAGLMAHAFVGWQVEMAPDGSLRRRVQHLCGTNRYDLIVGRYLWPLALAEAWKQAPVAVDLDNVGSKIASAGLRRGRLARAWHGRRARQLREAELRALDKCSLAWAAKQSDLPESGAVESRVLPNIAYRAAGSPLPDPDPINRRSTTTLIVASFSHVPNVRGVEEFLRYSWPQVLRSVPEASLRIVGSGISDHMKRRWQEVEGVSAVGFAENLDEEYRRAACTVVPLWEGGGTKIKVLESLLFGRPSVVSRHAWQGYEEVLHDRQSLWIADDSEDVARGCVELLRNYELRESMARAGREEVVHHYSFSRFRQAVRESVERAINSAPGRDSAS